MDNTSKQVMEVTISEEPRWEVEFVGGMVGNKGMDFLLEGCNFYAFFF